MGWVSQSSYLYFWGNGGGKTQTTRVTPQAKPKTEQTDDDKE